ncbi:MAG: hypothetical protein WA159_12955 [Variovorax sp.]
MSTDFRFTPASIGAFKHTARDLKKAYGSLALQQCQEVLAKIYGYTDLHALQEHLKTKPRPGPYAHVLSSDDQLTMAARPLRAFSSFAPPSTRPTGRRDIQDLAVFEEPERRKERMAQEDFRDAVATGAIPSEVDASVRDYVSFEVFDQDPHLSIMPISRKRGTFKFTEKGYAVYLAIGDQMDVFYSECSEEVSRAALGGLQAALQKMPNNPYLRSWATTTYMQGKFPLWKAGDDEDLHGDVEDAIALWQSFKACRSIFDGLMPKGFRGIIDPKEAGNMAYFDVLYLGTRCAAIAGYRSLALAWARRIVRLDPRDSFGARFIVKALEEEVVSADE